jgi:nucleoside-diphosphate-sugar epimerase
MSKILVTGSEGYIGAVLVPVLEQAGHSVVRVDTGYFYDCCFSNEGIQLNSGELVSKDVRNLTKENLRGVDCIIHLAALSNDPMGELDPYLTLEINYLASVRLADLAKQAGVRKFIFSSSCSVYGSTDEVVNETYPTNPLTTYALSKVRTEQDISKLASPNFSPVFMRNATVFGCSPMFRADVVVNNLTLNAYLTDKILLNSDGQADRPFIYVGDLAEAFKSIAEADPQEVHNEIFNIGNPNTNYKIIEVAQAIEKIKVGSQITFGPNASRDHRNYRVSYRKFEKYFPYGSRRLNTSIEFAIEELIRAFQSQLISFDDITRYTRLDELKRLIATNQVNSKLYWC